jgi:hypothetical protein
MDMNEILMIAGQASTVVRGLGQGQGVFAPVGLSQILTTASKLDIALPATQGQERTAFPFGIFASTPIDPVVYDPDVTTPRLPGLARGRVLQVSADFDAPIEWGI